MNGTIQVDYEYVGLRREHLDFSTDALEFWDLPTRKCIFRVHLRPQFNHFFFFFFEFSV
jgi:hypothetical protein